MLIKKIEKFVKIEMEWLCSAHDFFHIDRVRKLALKLAQLEWKWDALVVEAWALLHESLDDKFFWDKDLEVKITEIKDFLIALNLSSQQVDDIVFIVKNVGFWKSLERAKDFKWTVEFEIVEDADRLEAIWAIAIARTFAYWWKKWRPIYDPTIQPNSDLNRKSYSKSENTTINHFYEKLLLLKDLMHTNSWAKIARERHEFMEVYLEKFYKERSCDI